MPSTSPSAARLSSGSLILATLITANGGVPLGHRRRLIPGLLRDGSYGQVKSNSKGFFAGCMGLAMSMPYALPVIL